jgi:hypothetical protein
MAINQTSSPEFWAIKLHSQHGTFKVLIAHPASGAVGRILDGSGAAAAYVGQDVSLYTAAHEPVLTFEQLVRLQKQPLFWRHASPAALKQSAIGPAGEIGAMGWYPTQPRGDYLPPLLGLGQLGIDVQGGQE